MTQDEIIEMAREAGINYREFSDEFATGNGDGVEIEQMEAFASLVAKHTLMNIDPSKFMSHQEVMEAARLAEREACAKVADNRLLLDASSKERNIYDLARKNIAADIRARGEQA